MKTATASFVGRILYHLNDSDSKWEWTNRWLGFRGTPAMTIYPDGRVSINGLGTVPLDWTQRRSVARAYKRLHARLTEQLVEAGKKALAEKNKQV